MSFYKFDNKRGVFIESYEKNYTVVPEKVERRIMDIFKGYQGSNENSLDMLRTRQKVNFLASETSFPLKFEGFNNNLPIITLEGKPIIFPEPMTRFVLFEKIGQWPRLSVEAIKAAKRIHYD